MDPQTSAQASFSQLGFLILSNLPKGSDFGLDGQVWTVNDFNGVKFIPPGLHLFSFSAAPKLGRSTSTSDSANDDDQESTEVGSGLGVRHALFKFFEKGETLVEEWDQGNESLAYQTVGTNSSGSSSAVKDKRRHKRRRMPRNEEKEEGTVVSTEYLQTLDRSLAPYPDADSEHARIWTGLSGYVTEKTVARVLGVDAKGVARVDALLEGWGEEEELRKASERQKMREKESDEKVEQVGEEGKTFWGKKRPQEEAEVGEIYDDEDEGDRADTEDREGLEFARFDEKRSWPKGAVGADLSRWSKDKSWLLSEVVATQFEGDAKELLAELELSFILFTLVYNFSALSSYKSLFSLICRSTLLAHPSSSRPKDCNATLPSPLLESEITLPLLASFLAVLQSQLSFLDTTFFATQLPSLESHLLSSLDRLRSSLSDASPAWYALPSDSPATKVWKTLVARWNALAASTMEKFGWDLGLIEGSKARYGELKEELGKEGEVPFEELEEGEDAPVIVDLEDGDDAPILVGF